MYLICMRFLVRCHMIFVLYAEGYMMKHMRNWEWHLKCSRGRKCVQGEGRKAESGCTLHAVFPLGQSMAGSERVQKRG